MARNAWTRKLILPVTMSVYYDDCFRSVLRSTFVPPRRSITSVVGPCERQKRASSCHTSRRSLYLSRSFDRHRRQYKTALFAAALWAYKVRGHICPLWSAILRFKVTIIFIMNGQRSTSCGRRNFTKVARNRILTWLGFLHIHIHRR